MSELFDDSEIFEDFCEMNNDVEAMQKEMDRRLGGKNFDIKIKSLQFGEFTVKNGKINREMIITLGYNPQEVENLAEMGDSKRSDCAKDFYNELAEAVRKYIQL